MTKARSVPGSPGATSTDGRLFRSTVTDALTFPPGILVSLQESGGPVRLGQVDDHTVDRDGALTITGRVYATVDEAGHLTTRSTPFSSATVVAADSALVDLLNQSVGAVLDVGRLTSISGAPARLMPHRFNRHTFWCGQSGSGKTYALGVLLEELLLHTELPMVVFDPNADFVRLGEVRDDAPRDRAAALGRRPVRVLRAGDQSGESLRVQFTALGRSAKAAVMRLDPLIDPAEYNTLLHLEETLNVTEPGQILPALRASADPAVTGFAVRMENLGLLSWEIWAVGRRPATDIIAERPAATVLDLGGFRSREEPLVVALSVLDDLWSRRNERRPALLVIDEAHNLCSPDAETALERAVLERIIQIAAEGRKYGLWLLLSTQRPSKVHQGIISQCDNLALMRMGSQRDLDELGSIFSFAPPALVAQSPLFRQGEALFAGGFVPAPSAVQMRQRLTHEGGHDVGVPLPTTR
jgi:DNA helicase HerA-like ATPase